MNSKSANEAIRITNEDREVADIKMAQSKLSFCNETNFFALFRKLENILFSKLVESTLLLYCFLTAKNAGNLSFGTFFGMPYGKILKGVIFVGND